MEHTTLTDGVTWDFISQVILFALPGHIVSVLFKYVDAKPSELRTQCQHQMLSVYYNYNGICFHGNPANTFTYSLSKRVLWRKQNCLQKLILALLKLVEDNAWTCIFTETMNSEDLQFPREKKKKTKTFQTNTKNYDVSHRTLVSARIHRLLAFGFNIHTERSNHLHEIIQLSEN